MLHAGSDSGTRRCCGFDTVELLIKAFRSIHTTMDEALHTREQEETGRSGLIVQVPSTDSNIEFACDSGHRIYTAGSHDPVTKPSGH